tara:strand:- start:98 stop:202 length:105 start_codon:yes stop_codon:yes gene_type:complete
MKEFLLVVVGFIFGAAIGVNGVVDIGNKIVNLFS